MNKKYIYLIFCILLSACKNETKPEAVEPKKIIVKDTFIVVENFEDTFIHPNEKITSIFDRYRSTRNVKNDPEVALTLEFMTKKRRVAWCRFLPVNKNVLLKPGFYQSNTFGFEDDEDIQILGIRMQIVDEQLFKKKQALSPTSIGDVFLENTEYYCAYIDYAGNQYIARFKVPPFKPIKYHKYKLKGKLVNDLTKYNRHFVPDSPHIEDLIK